MCDSFLFNFISALLLTNVVLLARILQKNKVSLISWVLAKLQAFISPKMLHSITENYGYLLSGGLVQLNNMAKLAKVSEHLSLILNITTCFMVSHKCQNSSLLKHFAQIKCLKTC